MYRGRYRTRSEIAENIAKSPAWRGATCERTADGWRFRLGTAELVIRATEHDVMPAAAPFAGETDREAFRREMLATLEEAAQAVAAPAPIVAAEVAHLAPVIVLFPEERTERACMGCIWPGQFPHGCGGRGAA